MARIRTIKPEFWKHEGLSELPEATHLLAAALLNYADDEGYFNANPALIKAECFPLRDLSRTVPEALRDLTKEGYLKLGTAPNGRRYGCIVHFGEHQVINKSKPSKIKPLGVLWDEDRTDTVAVPDEYLGEQEREQGKEQRKEQGKTITSAPRTATDDGAVHRIFDHWRVTHAHPKAVLNEERRRLIRERLKDYSEPDLCQAIAGYRHSPYHMGNNDRDTKYDSIELFLRNSKQVEAGLKFYTDPPRTHLSEKSRRLVDGTEDWEPPEERNADV